MPSTFLAVWDGLVNSSRISGRQFEKRAPAHKICFAWRACALTNRCDGLPANLTKHVQSRCRIRLFPTRSTCASGFLPARRGTPDTKSGLSSCRCCPSLLKNVSSTKGGFCAPASCRIMGILARLSPVTTENRGDFSVFISVCDRYYHGSGSAGSGRRSGSARQQVF